MNIDTALRIIIYATACLPPEMFMVRSDYHIYKITLMFYMKRKSHRKGEKSMAPC